VLTFISYSPTLFYLFKIKLIKLFRGARRKINITKMKKTMSILGAMIFASFIFSGCGGGSSSSKSTNDSSKVVVNTAIKEYFGYELEKQFGDDNAVFATDFENKSVRIKNVLIVNVMDNTEGKRIIKGVSYDPNEIFNGTLHYQLEKYCVANVNGKDYQLFRPSATISISLQDPHEIKVMNNSPEYTTKQAKVLKEGKLLDAKENYEYYPNLQSIVVEGTFRNLSTLTELRLEDAHIVKTPVNTTSTNNTNTPSTNATPAPTTSASIAKPSTSTNYYKIQDPDGYTNLRKEPNGSIIKKIYTSEKFEVIGTEGKFKKVKLSDGTIGYIHESRVVAIK